MYSFEFHLHFNVRGISYENGYNRLESAICLNLPEELHVWFVRRYTPVLSSKRLLKGSLGFKHGHFSDSDFGERVKKHEPVVRGCLQDVFFVRGILFHSLSLTVPHYTLSLALRKTPDK